MTEWLLTANYILDISKGVGYFKNIVARSSGQELKSRIALNAMAAFFVFRFSLLHLIENEKGGESNG